MSADLTTLSNLDELSLEDIDAVLSGGSEKGKYVEDLLTFAESGKMGVPYQFSGKKAASVKTGMDSAKEKIAKETDKYSDEIRQAVANTDVKVRKVGEGEAQQELVFLIREDLRRAAKSAA